VTIEREFKTQPCTRATSSRTPLSPRLEDGSAEVWCTTQGHYIVRAHCARLLGMDIARSESPPRRSAAASAARPSSYLEPRGGALQKAKRPVKMVIVREDVFKASGPTSGAHVKVKMARPRTAVRRAVAELKYQAGAFQGSPSSPA
jgi:CO/xanthine dehydrogenase Mo-binding subunit